MNTIRLPHAEYAYPGQPGTSIANGLPTQAPSFQQNTQTNDNNNGAGLAVHKERFAFGVASDIIKNVGKIMTGSLFTDLLKGILKDKDQTWEQVLYSTLVDSGPSRIFTDFINAFAVRTMPFLPPEVSSQIFATPSVLFFRAATSGENVNANSAKKGMSEREAQVQDEIMKRPFVKWVKGISKVFKKHIQPKLDVVFRKAFGVKAGEILKDKNGNVIYDEKGKKMKSNPEVNLKHLMTVAFGFVGATAFLPRHTKATGSDAVQTPLRATINTLTTSLFRLNTTLLHNGVGPHIKGGANFDKCWNTSVQEKTLVPLIQYASDNIGALLSQHIPMNGAILAILTRLATEIPSTFLSSGLVNLSKGDRMPETWRILGQRIWLPVTKQLREGLKPMYKFLAQNVYSKFVGGMFDPKIKDMYDADIGETKQVDLDPELDAKYPKGIFNTGKLFAKETFKLFGEIPDILGNCKVDSDFKRNADRWAQKSVNRRIDFENKFGFRPPTHDEAAKAKLTAEQKEFVERIESKELVRGFKMVWDEKLKGYKKTKIENALEKDADKDEVEESDNLTLAASLAKVYEKAGSVAEFEDANKKEALKEDQGNKLAILQFDKEEQEKEAVAKAKKASIKADKVAA